MARKVTRRRPWPTRKSSISSTMLDITIVNKDLACIQYPCIYLLVAPVICRDCSTVPVAVSGIAAQPVTCEVTANF